MPDIMQCYRELYDISAQMLEMTREECWDDFVELATRYMIKKQDITHLDCGDITAAEKCNLKVVLKQVIDNEAEINRNLRGRLTTLKQKLSSLHHNTQCSQLYSRQQISLLH